MIKWINKSLGRKAVVFVVVFILLMSLGIFQMMFYASTKGYSLSEEYYNMKLSGHTYRLFSGEDLDRVCEKGKEFYLSHENLYQEFTDDSEKVIDELEQYLLNDEAYRKFRRKVDDLYYELGTDIFRLILVDYEEGTVFSFFTEYEPKMDLDQRDYFSLTKVEPFQPSEEEDPLSDILDLEEQESPFGDIYCVPYRLSVDRENGVGLYLTFDTFIIINKFIAIGLILRALLILILVTVIIGILILLLMKRTVINPLNGLSEATREIVQNLSEDEHPVRVYDKVNIHTGDEIEHLFKAISAMEEGIYDYMDQLEAATAEKERLGTELDIARGIQAHMLPSTEPGFSNQECFDLAASMHPAKEVGGDFYDFFMLSEDKLAFLIADVSGKGVPASLVMAIGKTMLKNFTEETGSIADAFRIVNNLLIENNSESMFITAFEGILNLRTGELLYANAGHEDPFVMRAGGTFELKKEKHSIVLGAMEDMRYKVHSMTLEPGDRLYIYTDGVPEAQDIDYKMFGLDRTRETLDSVCDKPAAEVIESIRQSVNAFVGEAPQFDDMTMLFLDFKKYLC